MRGVVERGEPVDWREGDRNSKHRWQNGSKTPLFGESVMNIISGCTLKRDSGSSYPVQMRSLALDGNSCSVFPPAGPSCVACGRWKGACKLVSTLDDERYTRSMMSLDMSTRNILQYAPFLAGLAYLVILGSATTVLCGSSSSGSGGGGGGGVTTLCLHGGCDISR